LERETKTGTNSAKAGLGWQARQALLFGSGKTKHVLGKACRRLQKQDERNSEMDMRTELVDMERSADGNFRRARLGFSASSGWVE
jgi:hypothetical protein